MVKRIDANEISGVVISFVDYLFENSHYLIFEKPVHGRTINFKRGYRPQTKNIGSDRRKSLNWGIQMITPSKPEIENYVKEWVAKQIFKQAPDNQEKWNSLILAFLDDFVKVHLITESPQTDRSMNYYLDYRPTAEKLDARVFFSIRFLQPNKIELERIVREWFSGCKSSKHFGT